MTDVPPSSLFSVLLVEPDHVDRVLAHSALVSAGFNVTATNNFEDALALLVSRPPLVLVSAVRLGADTGVALAARARSGNPHIAVLLTSSMPDSARQRETEAIGATFVLKPVTPEDLLAATCRTAMRQDGAAAASEPIRPPFERRRSERRREQAANIVEERRHLGRRRDLASALLGIAAGV